MKSQSIAHIRHLVSRTSTLSVAWGEALVDGEALVSTTSCSEAMKRMLVDPEYSDIAFVVKHEDAQGVVTTSAPIAAGRCRFTLSNPC